jgi:hypothetical protein
MTKLTLDQAMLSKLSHLKEPVEVCDESGHTLGYYTPATDSSLYKRVKVPFNEDELDRFEQEPGGRSLAEILADLEKRA